MSTSSPLRRRLDPIARYTLPSEVIEVNRRLHWSVIVPWFAGAMSSLFVAGYVTGQMTDRSGPLDDVIWLAALAMMGRMVWVVLEWNNDRFIVTSRRIMMVTGLVTRKVAMMPLFRVTDMTYNRSLMGRIFGWGTFVVESAGQDQALRIIDRVPSPDLLYQRVCSLMFDTEESKAAPADTEDPRPHSDRDRDSDHPSPGLELDPYPTQETF